MSKAMIITWSGFQDQEVIYPYYRLQEEGFDVEILSDVDDVVHGIYGIGFGSKPLYLLNEYDRFDVIVLPGGVKALEKLRQQKQVLDFINEWNKTGKIIASICHGAQLLISAQIVKGRRISGYYSIKDDINNAGGIYVDEPAVVDGNIISSPHYKHMGEWMKKTIEVWKRKK